jgi:hypothetical protein
MEQRLWSVCSTFGAKDDPFAPNVGALLLFWGMVRMFLHEEFWCGNRP